MQRPPLAGDRETKNGIPAIHHSLVEGDGGLAGLALIPQDLEGVSVETLDIWLAEDGGWVVGLDVEMYADAEASDELAELMAGMDSVSIAVRISITQPNDRGIRVTAPVSSSSGPSAQPAVPLKIALLVPYTGVLSDFGIAFERSAELAVKEINQAGGVLGEAVALVTGDSATDPVTAQEEARRLVEVERVSAVVGAAASGVTLPVAESVTVPSRILQISPSATSPALTSFADGDYLFRTYISDAAQGVILAGLARARGFTSACTMYVNNAYGEGLSEQFTESFEELGGTVTVQVSHAAEEQISYLSEVNECVQGNPDVLAAISYPEHGQVYLREALEAGLIDRFIFVDGTKSDRMFRALGWANFEGMYGTAPGGLATVPGTAFTASYEAEYGEKPPLPFMRESYDAVYVIALAAAKANSTDSTAIRDALRDIANPPGEVVNPGVGGFRRALELIGAGTDIDYQGTSGPIDFDQNGDVLQGAIEEWRIGGGEIVDAVRTFEVNLGTTPPTVTEVTR